MVTNDVCLDVCLYVIVVYKWGTAEVSADQPPPYAMHLLLLPRLVCSFLLLVAADSWEAYGAKKAP